MEGFTQKVTGTFVFTSDIRLPGMLIARALYPEYPRAKIISLDTSAAEAIIGVEVVKIYLDIIYGIKE